MECDIKKAILKMGMPATKVTAISQRETIVVMRDYEEAEQTRLGG